MKKPPSKVAHNQPSTFFFNTGPAAKTAQKQKSRTPKSPLMQDWVFRLGKHANNYCIVPLPNVNDPLETRTCPNYKETVRVFKMTYRIY